MPSESSVLNMNLKKSARSLYDLSLSRVQELLLDMGRRSIQTCGSYSREGCENSVLSAQEFLSSELLPFFLDDTLNSFTKSQVEHDKEAWLVVLDVLMHPAMKVFWPTFPTAAPPLFYETKLATMNQLVALNLHGVCTDEILSVVGLHCPALEMIDISSKFVKRGPYYVSDEGLACLHNCKKLRQVLISDAYLSTLWKSGWEVTHNGIIRLIQHLPQLEFINYTDMGLVFNELPQDSSVLSLKELKYENAVPSHVDIFDRYCPNLQKLSLSDWEDKCHSGLFMTKLTDSRLVLSSLRLSNIRLGDGLARYLELKGRHLTCLNLTLLENYDNEVGAAELLSVAKHCPYLNELSIRPLRDSRTEPIPPLPQPHPYLRNLTHLTLTGEYWDPYFFLPLCLKNASDLRLLELHNIEYRSPLGDCVLKILQTNPLEKLEELRVYDTWNMSPEDFLTLLASCKSLKKIVVPDALSPCLVALGASVGSSPCLYHVLFYL